MSLLNDQTTEEFLTFDEGCAAPELAGEPALIAERCKIFRDTDDPYGRKGSWFWDVTIYSDHKAEVEALRAKWTQESYVVESSLSEFHNGYTLRLQTKSAHYANKIRKSVLTEATSECKKCEGTGEEYHHPEGTFDCDKCNGTGWIV